MTVFQEIAVYILSWSYQSEWHLGIDIWVFCAPHDALDVVVVSSAVLTLVECVNFSSCFFYSLEICDWSVCGMFECPMSYFAMQVMFVRLKHATISIQWRLCSRAYRDRDATRWFDDVAVACELGISYLWIPPTVCLIVISYTKLLVILVGLFMDAL